MSASSTSLQFTGPAGVVDCVLDLPAGQPRGWALVLHPHPLHGGARDNKVVTTLARACTQQGLAALRPNFRGVGASAGEFDHARGETEDMLALLEQLPARLPELAALPWVMGGFSFGTAVAARVHDALPSGARPRVLALIGAAVSRFSEAGAALRVPDDALMVHGETDEVVPLSEAMSFAREQAIPIVVIPDASHFFHGKLIALRQIVQLRLQALFP
jgi:alpha/beta superfamily hydrolase